MTPAAFLDRLDRAAADHEVKARELRRVGDKLRVALGTEVAQSQPEPVRTRAKAARGHPTSNPAIVDPGAPAPQAEPARRSHRGAARIYPVELTTDRARFLFRMRREGLGGMADDIETGRRELYPALYELGWKKPPRKAANLRISTEPEAAAGSGDHVPAIAQICALSPEPAEPAVNAPIGAVTEPEHHHVDADHEPHEPHVGIKHVEVAEDVDAEVPEPEPAKPTKPKSRVWSPEDIAEADVHPSSLPRAVDPARTREVDAVAAQAQAAAAAAAQRREQMRASEPPPRWSNPDNRFRTLVASYDDRHTATAGGTP